MRGKGKIFKAVFFMFLFLGVMGASAAFALTTVFSINHEDPAAAYNSEDNEFLVVALNKARGGDTEGALEGVITDANGNPKGPTFVIDGRVSNDWCAPVTCEPAILCFDDNVAVAYNSDDNEYVVVWEDEDTNDDGTDDTSVIKAVIVSSTGSVSAEVPIADSTRVGFRPDVAYNSEDNTFLIVWVSEAYTAMEGRLASADLNTLGAIQTYEPDAGGDDDNEEIVVAYSPDDNQFLVVWENNLNDSVPDIQGRYANNVGTPLGGVIVIDADASEDADDPRVTYDSKNNQYLVVWEDDQDGSDDEHILGRIVRGDQGGVSGGNIDITSSSSSDDRDNPDAAYCPDGDKFLVVFENNEDDSVEGQYVSGTGSVQGDVMLIAPDPGSASPPPGTCDATWQRDDPRVEFNTTNGTFFAYFENEEGWACPGWGEETQSCFEDIYIEAELVDCPEDLPVPTLGQWGVMALSLILGGAAFLRMRRRKRD